MNQAIINLIDKIETSGFTVSPLLPTLITEMLQYTHELELAIKRREMLESTGQIK